MWMKLLGNRAAITSNHDENYIDFFQLRSLTMDTKIHMNASNALFHDFGSTRLRIHLRRSATLLRIGLRKQTIYEMKLLSSLWLLETGEMFEDFKEAYEHLKPMPTVSNCLIGEMKRSCRRQLLTRSRKTPSISLFFFKHHRNFSFNYHTHPLKLLSTLTISFTTFFTSTTMNSSSR